MESAEQRVPEFRYRRVIRFTIAAFVAMAAGAGIVFLIRRI
jgi:hypothetical protein